MDNVYRYIDNTILILDKYNDMDSIDFDEFKYELIDNYDYTIIHMEYNEFTMLRITFYIIYITGQKYNKLFKYISNLNGKYKNIYIKLHPNTNLEISDLMINKFKDICLLNELNLCIKNYKYYDIYPNELLKYIIYTKN